VKHHQQLLTAAIARDGEGQRALIAGDLVAAREPFTAAAELYRQSWEEAPPRSYGRLVGMLKAGILSGEDQRPAAAYAREALGADSQAQRSPTASYALALAALVAGDDDEARQHAEVMHGASEAFDRAATAIAALAGRDGDAYSAAITEIVRDFERRPAHLTGVAIADTALVLERLAAPRGLSAGVQSEVFPP
jgi:uncharacterized Ntn-hydrolase superfamily protein